MQNEGDKIYNAIHKAVWLQIEEAIGTSSYSQVKRSLRSVLSTAHLACYPCKDSAETVLREEDKA